MPCPTFADLGKSARDVFSKGYHVGVFKLESKARTPNDVKLTVSGENNMETNQVTGRLESEYHVAGQGLTLKEHWTTDNVLSLDCSLTDHLLEGLRLSTDLSFAPISGKRTARLKSVYTNDNVNVANDVDVFPVVKTHSAAVIQYNGWLAGAQLSFDVDKRKMLKNAFSFGYQTAEFAAHCSVKDGAEFGGSVYQKLNKKVESGVQLGWTSASNVTRLALGCRYTVDRHSTVRVKVNNNCQLGLSYQQTVRHGVTLTLSAQLEGGNLTLGSNKVGLGLDFSDL